MDDVHEKFDVQILKGSRGEITTHCIYRCCMLIVESPYTMSPPQSVFVSDSGGENKPDEATPVTSPENRVRGNVLSVCLSVCQFVCLSLTD
jgi:hypothetical protein